MDPLPAITAVVVLILLAVIMRWVFTPTHPRRGRPANAAEAADARRLGLLSVVSTIDRSEVEATQATLTSAGIRSSMSRRDDGRLDVLVFTGDHDRARAALVAR